MLSCFFVVVNNVLPSFLPLFRPLAASRCNTRTTTNHHDRPTAEEALSHPWILSGLEYSDDELWYPPDEDHAVRQDEDDGADDEECDGGGGGGGVAVGVVIEEYVGVGGMAGVEGHVGGEGEGEGVVSPRRSSV